MMNSMNNVEDLNELVNNKFDVVKTEVVNAEQMSFIVEPRDVHTLLTLLKTSGWKQLSYLSAIDWIEEDEFELVYIVFNWDKPVHVQVRTRIKRDRENASFETIIPIFPGAKYYEREVHEFFGIKFPGNPDFHKQLILENWDDMPPLLKDFDPRAYSDSHFEKRDYPEKHINLNNQESKQAKRQKRNLKSLLLRNGGKK